MKKKIILVMAILLVLSMSVLSCAAWRNLIGRGKSGLTVTVENYKTENYSMDGVTFTFDVVIENNEKEEKGTLYSYNYVLDFGEGYTIEGETVEETVEILPDSKHKITITEELNFVDIAAYHSDFDQKESITVSVSGVAKTESGKGEHEELTFGSDYDLPIPSQPTIRAGVLTVKELDYSHVILGFGIEVDNPNVFQLQLKSLKYKIKFNSSEVKSINDDDYLITVEADSKTTHEVTDLIELTYLSDNIIQSEQIDVDFTATIKYSSYTGPETVQLAITDNFAPAIIPTIDLEQVSPKIEGDSADLNLIMTIFNKNDFDVNMVEWYLTVENLKDNYEVDPVNIEPGENQVRIAVPVNPNKLGSINYTIISTMFIESLLGNDDIEIQHELTFP